MSVDPSNSAWSFQLRPAVVPNNVDVPIYQWFPDAHITILENKDSDGILLEEDPYIMFWSGGSSYRSIGGPTPYPEDQRLLDPPNKILGGNIDDADRYNNGGMWLNSVFRKSDITNNTNTNTNRLIGFYHAEDHYYGTSNNGNIAWKSMGVAISRDNGYTWRNRGQFLSSGGPKPDTPEWGGAADGCVIWHEPDQRWICYYATHNMAMSEDPEGTADTWFKYFEGDFTQPGLGGQSTQNEALMRVPGANPSVHYNTYLEMWVMVFHSWSGGCIYISSSLDAYEWSEPQEVLCSEHKGGKTWYPTIIGESDVLAGEKARLYYADMYDGKRDFIGQEIVFTRTDDDEERRVLVSEERILLPKSQLPVVESLETSAITSDVSVAKILRGMTTASVPSNTGPWSDSSTTPGGSSSAKSFLTATMLGSSILLLSVSFFASICA